MKKINSVAEYLKGLPKEQRVELERLRTFIRKLIPKEAQEKMSYGIPTFTYKGNLVHYAAFKDHFSFFPGGKTITEKYAAKLGKKRTGAATIQYTLDDPLPDSITEAIVKKRVKENETKGKK